MPNLFLNLSHQPWHETVFDIWEKNEYIYIYIGLSWLNEFLIRLKLKKRDMYVYKRKTVYNDFFWILSKRAISNEKLINLSD